MGRLLTGSLVLILTITYSSAYHRYHHFKPRDVYDEYGYSAGKDHSAEEDPTYEADEPNVHEELNAPEYGIQETADLNEIPDNARANAPSTGYEVTEDVDDIPNPMEFQPIIANYSKEKPLNFAGVNRTNEQLVNKADEKEKTPPKDVVTHEDLYSFSESFPEVKESFDDIKDSFGKVKTSFFNDLNGIKDKVLKKMNEPVSYFNRLHKKANDVINNINQWFDFKNDDEEDFETFE